MHIPLDEALSLLSSWRNEGTHLRIYASGSGFRRDFLGTIRELKGKVVEFCNDRTQLQVDLQGATFNGDVSLPRISRMRISQRDVTHSMFYETGVLRWGRSCRSELFTCLSGAAIRSGAATANDMTR